MRRAGRSSPDQETRHERCRDWCREHARRIAASGIPSSVVADEAHWRDFLEISDLYPVDFDRKRLMLSQKAALLRLISTRPIDCRTPVALSMIQAVLDALEPRA